MTMLRTKKTYTDLLKNRTNPVPPLLLALDPGDHIGHALFRQGYLAEFGEYHGNTHLHNIDWLQRIMSVLPSGTRVVCEDYRIYGDKAAAHINSRVETIKLIGAIEAICLQQNLKLSLQMAATGKGFFTDEKLKAYWQELNHPHPNKEFPSSPHAKDAIRHGMHFLVFAR